MKYADFDFVRHQREEGEQAGGADSAAAEPLPSLELDPPTLPEALDFRVAATVVAQIDACGMALPLALLQARRAVNGLAVGQVLEIRCCAREDTGAWKAFARVSNLILSILPDRTPDSSLLHFRRG